jgi:hypothetical protein
VSSLDQALAFAFSMTTLLGVPVILSGMVLDHAEFSFASHSRTSRELRGEPKRFGGALANSPAWLNVWVLFASMLPATLAMTLFALLHVRALSTTVTLCHNFLQKRTALNRSWFRAAGNS